MRFVRSIGFALFVLGVACPALAQVRVDYVNDVPRVRLEGSYAGSQ